MREFVDRFSSEEKGICFGRAERGEAKARNSKEGKGSPFARAQLACDSVLTQWDSCKLSRGNVLSIVNASRVYCNTCVRNLRCCTVTSIICRISLSLKEKKEN